MADQRLVELDDGGVLNVVELGSGHPLVLLHGVPASITRSFGRGSIRWPSRACG